MSTVQSAQPLLELRGVGKRYGAVEALVDVSASVYPGGVMGLVGGNGAGKSTLVKILSGVHGRDSGDILWKGSSVSFKNPSDARAIGIDTVYQDLALAGELDATANLFLNREIGRGFGPFRVRNDAEMRRQAADLFERFGIDMPIDSKLRSMSGGQQQGVAIGRALLGGSELILLDEPTAALGVRESRNVEEIMHSLAQQGVALILVSHSVDQLLKVCDSLLVLRRGEMVGLFESKGLNTRDVVSLIVGADELDVEI